MSPRPAISMSSRRSKRFKVEEESQNVEKEKELVQEEEAKDSLDDIIIDDYEQIRRENIQRNLQFLDSIGINDIKSTISSHSITTKPISRGISSTRRKNVSNTTPIPQRRSGRVTIERLKREIDDSVASGSADVTVLDKKRSELEVMVAQKAAATYDVAATYDDNTQRSRLSPDPVTLLTPLNQPKHAEENHSVDWGHGLLPLLQSNTSSSPNSKKRKNTVDSKLKTNVSSTSLASYRASIQSLNVIEKDVAKVVPQRITAITMHPSNDRTLVIAGDKQGYVGFWNADEGNNVIGGKAQVGGEDGVYLYQPHVSNVSSLYVSPSEPQKLWSVSYDGTIRTTDIERQAFIQTFVAPGELYETSFYDAAFGSQSEVYLGCGNGDVMMVDSRTGTAGWTAAAHDCKINSIQIHPAHEHILVTASSGMNGYIAVHDTRKVGSSKKWESLFVLNGHSRSINAAYLSPGNGEYLVSVALDNTVNVWKDIMSNSQKPVMHSFSHDNHTGRWLSTLKPAFDPKVDSTNFASFLLGSMVKPRRVEVYTIPSAAAVPKVDSLLTLAGEFLGSVCSRNCFHPSRNIIAGGNSSGKVHLFR